MVLQWNLANWVVFLNRINLTRVSTKQVSQRRASQPANHSFSLSNPILRIPNQPSTPQPPLSPPTSYAIRTEESTHPRTKGRAGSQFRTIRTPRTQTANSIPPAEYTLQPSHHTLLILITSRNPIYPDTSISLSKSQPKNPHQHPAPKKALINPAPSTTTFSQKLPHIQQPPPSNLAQGTHPTPFSTPPDLLSEKYQHRKFSLVPEMCFLMGQMVRGHQRQGAGLVSTVHDLGAMAAAAVGIWRRKIGCTLYREWVWLWPRILGWVGLYISGSGRSYCHWWTVQFPTCAARSSRVTITHTENRASLMRVH